MASAKLEKGIWGTRGCAWRTSTEVWCIDEAAQQYIALRVTGEITRGALPPPRTWFTRKPKGTDASAPSYTSRGLWVGPLDELWLERCVWHETGDGDPCAASTFVRIDLPRPIMRKRTPAKRPEAKFPDSRPARHANVKVRTSPWNESWGMRGQYVECREGKRVTSLLAPEDQGTPPLFQLAVTHVGGTYWVVDALEPDGAGEYDPLPVRFAFKGCKALGAEVTLVGGGLWAYQREGDQRPVVMRGDAPQTFINDVLNDMKAVGHVALAPPVSAR